MRFVSIFFTQRTVDDIVKHQCLTWLLIACLNVSIYWCHYVSTSLTLNNKNHVLQCRTRVLSLPVYLSLLYKILNSFQHMVYYEKI